MIEGWAWASSVLTAKAANCLLCEMNRAQQTHMRQFHPTQHSWDHIWNTESGFGSPSTKNILNKCIQFKNDPPQWWLVLEHLSYQVKVRKMDLFIPENGKVQKTLMTTYQYQQGAREQDLRLFTVVYIGQMMYSMHKLKQEAKTGWYTFKQRGHQKMEEVVKWGYAVSIPRGF